MQSVSSRIWTRVAVSISDDDNHYTTLRYYVQFQTNTLDKGIHILTIQLWFGLVSLFNGISTLFRLFNTKAILLEEQ